MGRMILEPLRLGKESINCDRTMFPRILTVTILLFAKIGMCQPFEEALVAAAIERTANRISYDGSYFSIKYPNGDVPAHVGVCTDVIIRSYRALGTDLQQLVHEDMATNFNQYPSQKIWGLRLSLLSF